jgi:putative heme iron utilization protein
MHPESAFDARRVAKKLLREARSGALATLIAPAGDPYCSLVNVATDADGAPLLLLSRLAVHTKNIFADPRASLMLDERKEGDPLQGARITLMGTMVATEDASARRRYLARQPEAEMFASFGDFSLYRMTVKTAHLVAGFGRIVDLGAEDLLIETSDAGELLASEQDIVAHLNRYHLDTVRLYATRLLGARAGEWRCVGCDPEGLELQLGRTALRLALPERVREPAALREVLQRLAHEARSP